MAGPLDKLGSAWDATGGRIAEALRSFEGIAPEGGGADAAGDAFRNWVADNLGEVAYPSIPGVPSAGSAIDAFGKFQDWWSAPSPPTLQQPNPGAATIWDDASGSWVTGPGRAMPTQSERDAMIDPATGRFVYPPDPNAPVGSMDSVTNPADRNLLGLPSVQPGPPSSADLTSQLFDTMRSQNQSVFDTEIARLDERSDTLATMYAELEKMALDGVNGAADNAQVALAAMETTRLERLRVDEASATERLGELEAARVEQEGRVNTKIKDRGDALIAAYDASRVEVSDQLAGVGVSRTAPVHGGAGLERALLGQQAASQQSLTDRLTQATASEAVGRGMDLGAMYDQAALDLMDRVASQRSDNAASQQQQLLDIALASKQGEIGRYEADSAARGAAGQAQASGQGQIDLAQLQGQLQGTQSAEQSGLLEALLGLTPGTLGAAQSFGLTDNVFDLVTDDPSAGQTPYTLADGTDVMIDNEAAARLSAGALSDSQRTRIPAVMNGQTLMVSPSEYNELLRAGLIEVG